MRVLILNRVIYEGCEGKRGGFLKYLKIVRIKLKAVDLILRVKVLAFFMQSQVSVIEWSCNWFQEPSYGGSHIF